MSAKVEVKCPCGEALRVDASNLGKHGHCPSCGESFLIWSPEAARTAADKSWYVEMDGRPRGPVSFLQLRRLVSEGRVARDTRVRHGRDGVWIPAADARGDLNVAIPAAPLRKRRGPTRVGGGRQRSVWRPHWDPHVSQLVFGGLLVVLLLPILLFVLHGERQAEPPPRMSTAELVRRTIPSVAAIRGKRSRGSGFVVAPGVLVTNYHVIEHDLLRNVVVQFPSDPGNSGELPAELGYADPSADLALLRVPAWVKPLPLASRYAHQPGLEILVVGSPGIGQGDVVLHNAVARGLLSTSMELEGKAYYQLDVPVNPGNSGGPVIDEEGQVIGVVTAKALEGEQLAFALPLATLQRCLAAFERASASDSLRVAARHRLQVAEATLLPAARLYYVAMVAYILELNPGYQPERAVQVPNGGVTAILGEVDRRLVSDLRLEEGKIRTDVDLTGGERDRFERLWTVYAELKHAVEEPTGTLRDYTALCRSMAERLSRLERECQH